MPSAPHGDNVALRVKVQQIAAPEVGASLDHAFDEQGWRRVIARAAEQFGTPCYVARWEPVARAAGRLDRLGSAGIPVQSWLSFKTHPLPPLVRTWIASGGGVEVVSEVELAAACRDGASRDTLLVNGVAKHAWLRRRSMPHLRVHFDSLREIDELLDVAVGDRWRVGVRCHAPGERDARDARFGGQFGMTAAEAIDALGRLTAAGARVESMHFHLGQHAQSRDAYVEGVERLARVCQRARFEPRFIDLGGGLPSPPDAEPMLEGLVAAIAAARDWFGASLEAVWLENGRFLTEASTALAVRVLDVKERDDCRYLICDGGRTNQALAADNGPHRLLVLPPRHGSPMLTAICGPTCMTDDLLARLDLPRDVGVGDVIAWMDAGAYHLPWETRFSQPLCAVAWSEGAAHLVRVRERERPEAWLAAWSAAER
jgi:diaminopimelate decarboxylase